MPVCSSHDISKHCPPNKVNEPRHEISNNVVCATSKGSDQPAHMRSLIRAFASRLIKLPTEHYLEFLSLKEGCTGSSEFTLMKLSYCWKSHVAAQLIYQKIITCSSTPFNSCQWHTKTPFMSTARTLKCVHISKGGSGASVRCIDFFKNNFPFQNRDFS